MSSPVSDVVFEELRQAVTFAALNYEIWWVYKSSDTRPIYQRTMNRYSIHFLTGIHAHFVAMITALYRIFETRSDTHNFRNLVNRLREERPESLDRLDEYEAKFEALKPIWVKVSRLRNEAFSHRRLDQSIKDVFAEVQVTPDEFSGFIEETKVLLNDLSREFSNSVHAFNTGAREETLNLLEDLKRARDA